MQNVDLKEIENSYRELGIEGNDTFTLIASQYINFHQLKLSERLINILQKANEINCNGSKQKIEQITTEIVKNDQLGTELPIFYQYFHGKRFRDNIGKFFTPLNIVKSMVKWWH
jgi:hypothetical protein